MTIEKIGISTDTQALNHAHHIHFCNTGDGGQAMLGRVEG